MGTFLNHTLFINVSEYIRKVWTFHPYFLSKRAKLSKQFYWNLETQLSIIYQRIQAITTINSAELTKVWKTLITLTPVQRTILQLTQVDFYWNSSINKKQRKFQSWKVLHFTNFLNINILCIIFFKYTTMQIMQLWNFYTYNVFLDRSLGWKVITKALKQHKQFLANKK